MTSPADDLVAVFRTEAAGRVARLRAGLWGDGDQTGDDLRREAHTLRGAADMLGMTDAAAVAGRLEELFGDSGSSWRSDEARDLVDRLERALDSE